MDLELVWSQLRFVNKLKENEDVGLKLLWTSIDPELTQDWFARKKQGNSVARDLPRTGSETNTTIFVIYILDIDFHCPYLLSGETTFQLTSC